MHSFTTAVWNEHRHRELRDCASKVDKFPPWPSSFSEACAVCRLARVGVLCIPNEEQRRQYAARCIKIP